jgi:hypothetical protein
MAVITIRDIPPTALVQLGEQAAARGQSLQQFLRQELIELSERSTLAAQLDSVLESLPRVSLSSAEVAALLADSCDELARRDHGQVMGNAGDPEPA